MGAMTVPYVLVIGLYAVTGHLREFVYYYQRYGRDIFMAPLTRDYMRDKVREQIDRYFLGGSAVTMVAMVALSTPRKAQNTSASEVGIDCASGCPEGFQILGSAPARLWSVDAAANVNEYPTGLQAMRTVGELNELRKGLVQFLFTEGNHFCPSCEKSGNCELQALGYEYEMLTSRFRHFYPDRPVDASHPDVLLDFNRCIFCELCVRASRDVDGKAVFALTGRGINKHLVVNAESGRLGDTDFSKTDMAANICPVGVILHKKVGFAVPIGERTFDTATISDKTLKEGSS